MVPGGKSRARTRGDRGAAEEGGEASDGLESSLDEFMMTERALLAEAQDDGGAQQQQQDQEEGGDEQEEEGEESVPGFAKAIRRRGRREKGRGRRSGGSTHRRVGSTRTAQYYGQAETAQPADDGGNGRAYSSSWDKIHSLQIKLRECMADKEEMRDALDEAGLREGALRHQLEQVGAKAKKNNATAWKQRQRIELLEVRRTHPRPDSKFKCAAADAW